MKGSDKKGAKCSEKGNKGDGRTCWNCGKTRYVAAMCTKSNWNKHLCAVGEDDNDISDEVRDTDEDLQAWCTLVECEHEQWQEVIRRRGMQKQQQFAQTSVLSVETKQRSIPTVEKIIFFQNKGRNTQVLNVQQRERVVKSIILWRKVVQAGNVVMLDEKKLPSRNTQDATPIKLDVNSGVCTWWSAWMKKGRSSAGRSSDELHHRQPPTLCNMETTQRSEDDNMLKAKVNGCVPAHAAPCTAPATLHVTEAPAVTHLAPASEYVPASAVTCTAPAATYTGALCPAHGYEAPSTRRHLSRSRSCLLCHRSQKKSK